MSTMSVLLAALAMGLTAAAQPGNRPAQQGRQGTVGSEEQQIAEAIERALQKHGPEVHRCFERSLADRLDSAGKVEVEVEVGPGGQVTGARLLNQAGEVPPELSACVREAAKTWKMPGVEAGAAVVLPFSFEGQMNQFVVKAEDVPERGPGAGKKKGPAAAFTVKVLVDPVNVRNPHASLTLLTVGPARRVAMHRHPQSAKILYLLKGRARVLGPTGTPPIKADQGTAIFLPAGFPHVIENMARQEEATLLQIFSPPGPERVYRDPKDAEARTHFEVIRDPRVKAPADARPVVATWERPAAGGAAKSRAHVLLDQKTTGSPALSLSVLELGPGAALPRHSHSGASELLYVVEGGGKLTVGVESMPFGPSAALYLPPDQAHELKVNAGDATLLVQVFSPAGAEQSVARPAGGAPARK